MRSHQTPEVNMPKLDERFAYPSIQRQDLPDGSYILRSRDSIDRYPERILDYLLEWGVKRSQQAFLAERDAAGVWNILTYETALAKVRSLAQFFIDIGASKDRPVVTLTGNSIAHGLTQLASMYAGIPFAAISTSYSTIPDAFDKLDLCMRLLRPRVVMVENFVGKLDVIDRLALEDSVILTAGQGNVNSVRFEDAAHVSPSTIDRIFAQTGLDTVAKYIFTSGSTGMPKAVINTNRMISSNQQQLLQIYPVLKCKPPVLVDWLPWSHTFGGNQTFFLTLRHGGTMYIDAGKPVDGAFNHTIQNLREIAPTAYFNVPKAFEMLIPELQADINFCRHFFSEMQLIYYAGASLPQKTWSMLEDLSIKCRGERITIVTAWGTTPHALTISDFRSPDVKSKCRV